MNLNINKNKITDDLKSNISKQEEEIYNLNKMVNHNINERKYYEYINEKLKKEINILKDNIEELKMNYNKSLKTNNSLISNFLKIINHYNITLCNLYKNLPNIISNLNDNKYDNFNKLKGHYLSNQIKVDQWNKLFKIIPECDNKIKLKFIYNNLDKNLNDNYYENFKKNYSKLINKIKNDNFEKISFTIMNNEMEEEEEFSTKKSPNINYNNLYSERNLVRKKTMDISNENKDNSCKIRTKKKRTRTTLINLNEISEKESNKDLSFFNEINNMKLFKDIENVSLKSVEFKNKISFDNISNFILKILNNYEKKENLVCNLTNLTNFISFEINDYLQYFIGKITKLTKDINKIIYQFIRYITSIPKKFINIINYFFNKLNIEENKIFINIIDKITNNVNNLNFYFNQKDYTLFSKEVEKNKENLENKFINKINEWIN